MVRAALLPSLMALGMATAQAQSSDALRWWQHTALVDEKGPPSPPTDGMTRTPDGYIWMGSTTGLLRFDGVRFTGCYEIGDFFDDRGDKSFLPIFFRPGTTVPR